MSETSFTGYKRRITEYAEDHGHTISTSKVSRLALSLTKRQARMNDADLERIFTYADPTPRDAIRNIERQTA